jgi:hypothetical protein
MSREDYFLYSPRDPFAALATYFLCTGLRNQVGKIFLPYLRAGHPSASADKFHLGACAHKKREYPVRAILFINIYTRICKKMQVISYRYIKNWK